jgi:hypothetical protein
VTGAGNSHFLPAGKKDIFRSKPLFREKIGWKILGKYPFLPGTSPHQFLRIDTETLLNKGLSGVLWQNQRKLLQRQARGVTRGWDMPFSIVQNALITL